MISAFAHQLTELEKKTDEQGSQIYQICSRLQEDASENAGVQAGYDCKHLLNCLQSQIKQNSFKLNELHSKIIQHDVDISTLKGASNECHHQNTSYNPLASEFQPRLQVPFELTAADFASTVPVSAVAASATLVGDHRRPASAPYLSVSDYIGGEQQKDPNLGLLPQNEMFNGLGDKDCGNRDAERVLPREIPRVNRDTETMLLKEELMYCKNRIREMDMELESKNRVIRDLMTGHEQLMRKETEYAQKQDWYEHKMRLLKQDKRRRGETIGKLLRCIDDMKDTGRVDETKVTDGRAVLAATLGSRGLPTEERIRAAVDAAEAERIARHRAEAEAASAAEGISVHSMTIDENNHNNSAILEGLPMFDGIPVYEGIPNLPDIMAAAMAAAKADDSLMSVPLMMSHNIGDMFSCVDLTEDISDDTSSL